VSGSEKQESRCIVDGINTHRLFNCSEILKLINSLWNKKYKLPGIDQIPGELIQAGGETLHSEILKLVNCIWNKKYKSSDIGQLPAELIQAGD
jgi:hypothetical protein